MSLFLAPLFVGQFSGSGTLCRRTCVCMLAFDVAHAGRRGRPPGESEFIVHISRGMVARD